MPPPPRKNKRRSFLLEASKGRFRQQKAGIFISGKIWESGRVGSSCGRVEEDEKLSGEEGTETWI